MANLTIAQKLYLAALLPVAAAWIGLEIGTPIYEYSYGKSALTALLAQLSTVFMLVGLGILGIGWAMQSMGILPSVWRGQQSAVSAAWEPAPVGRLRNLAVWIVIALVLVFLFNLFQGSNGRRNPAPPAPPAAPMPDLLALFINWFPMLLIFAVWLIFLRQMKARQGNNSDKSNHS